MSLCSRHVVCHLFQYVSGVGGCFGAGSLCCLTLEAGGKSDAFDDAFNFFGSSALMWLQEVDAPKIVAKRKRSMRRI